MRCPFCGFAESKVIDSRAAEEGNSIRRRRECLSCVKRFTTYEVVEELPLMVIKKDGRRAIFDRGKLLNGLLRACEKRPIPLAVIEKIAEQVEKESRNNMEREITTRQIGEMVMEQLKEIDQVAYVRFASVYRQFADINNFMSELELLMKQGSKEKL
ncbi:transcriptional regulator NrdR [Propionispora vibrioides]|jgi:transcriptional repressor NrdR|uniref:Transcriptional repressor NrdR n=1 Tax=Propionispora vibrioides TaxID=112903 RepID=A0A1H8NH27_9FIRM|nr:transcriptional regulator NrdR [Propionispora vibrioides]SEO28895.1 transcriptional repressor NrdR [Propionispora vibrioides]